MNKLTRIRAVAAPAILGLLAACADQPTGSAELQAGPANLDVMSGQNQTAAPGAELPQPLVVRVTNASGTPIPGQIVNFKVTQGGGSVFAGAGLTNAQGIAQERWILGPTEGPQSVEVRAVDNATGGKLVFATFNATASTTPTPPPTGGDTIPPGRPGTPTFTTATVSADSFQVTATWGSASDAARYAWQTGANSGGFAREGEVTSATVGFRAARVTTTGYWFCVRAKDAAGNEGEVACASYNAPGTTSPPASPTVTTVTVSPDSRSFTAVGQTQQLAATARDQSGNTISTTFSWSSGNVAIATVSSSGLVTARGNGSTRIIVAAPNGVADTANVSVSTGSTPPPPPPPPTGGSEPTYDPARHALALSDNFDSYSSKTALMSAPNYRVARGEEWIALTSGRGGSGNAVRLQYGPSRAEDILFGPDRRWSYSHIFFTTWFRVSAGGDFTAGGTGIKGFMFQNANTGGNGYSSRYQFGVSRVRCWNPWKGYKEARGFLQADANECTGADLFKTPDGGGPIWSQYSDGNWHRVTFEIYTANSGHAGFRQWMDGVLVYDNVDRIPEDHYSPYLWNVTGVQVFGNYYPEEGSRPTTNVDMDFDDWTIWTDR